MKKLAVQRFAHEAMTTTFEVLVAGKTPAYARQAARAAFDEIDRIERLFSRFDPSSEISRISRLAPGESLQVGVETYECLAMAMEIQAETGGAFDINFRAIGAPLAGKKWSPAAEIRSARRTRTAERGRPSLRTRSIPMAPAPLGDLIRLSKVPGGFAVARRRPPNLRGANRSGLHALDLDLGALGKGYALDSAAAVLLDWGVDNVLLHAGTSTALGIGPGPGRAGWPVGVATSFPDCGAPSLLYLSGRALSGSGTEVKGRHIIDPRTGHPARRALAAWAAHPSAAVSDALSTAFFVMSPSSVRAFCRRRSDVWALVILGPKTCKIWYSEAVP